MAFFILPNLTIYTSLSQDGAKLFSDPASDPVSGARKAGSEVANVSWQTSSELMVRELREAAWQTSSELATGAGDRTWQVSSEVTDTWQVSSEVIDTSHESFFNYAL